MTDQNEQSAGQTASWGLFYMPELTRSAGLWASSKTNIFKAFLKEFQEDKGRKLPPATMKFADHAINEMIKNFDLVAIILDQERKKICYSRTRCNSLPTEFLDRVRRSIQAMPSDRILWANDVLKPLEACNASEVIYGAPPPALPADFDDQLRKLAKLKQEGLINDDEFNQKKRALLGI